MSRRSACISNLSRLNESQIEDQEEPVAYEELNVRDLTDLPFLSENAILACLRNRFSCDAIYTKMKNHIISMNPGRPIPGMYSEETMRKIDSNTAHIFSLGHTAFSNVLTRSHSSECIIISGESGSGKTESCRYLLNFLISRNIDLHPISDGKIREMERKIMQASPLLEAFGNAPTCNNRNSSRFGKFIELSYHPVQKTIRGARIQVYLLEKTRILHLKSRASNPFHVFQAMSSMDAGDREKFHLEDLSHCDDPIVSWSSITKAMSELDISDENINRVTAILSALVMISRLKFNHTENMNPDDAENSRRMKLIAELLGAEEKFLTACLMQNKFSSRRESVYIRACTPEECTARVDTLMKLMYQLLFEWLVIQANKNIACSSDGAFEGDTSEVSSISLLDMYGFECLNKNRLEQLCINYANEKLQQYFVESILVATKKEYEEEEVPFSSIDLTAVLEGQKVTTFLEQHLFPLLEEECRMQRRGVTVTRMAERLQSEVQPKFPSIVRRAAVDMSIRHYAGRVTYDLTDFLEQNADRVPADLFNLLTDSGLGRWLLSHQPVREMSSFVNGHKRRPAVCTQFRGAVSELVQRLNSSVGIQFVRCMKPSVGVGLAQHVRPPFEERLVLQQLHSSGILDTVRVCRAAIHPVRMKYEDFLQRFSCLFSSLLVEQRAPQMDSPSVYMDLEKGFRKQHRLPSTPPRSSSRSVRRRTGASEVDQQRRVCAAIANTSLSAANHVTADQFGRRRLFLTQSQADRLEAARQRLRNEAASVVQASVRCWLERRRFLRIRSAAVRIQCAVRDWRQRRVKQPAFTTSYARQGGIISSRFIPNQDIVRGIRHRERCDRLLPYSCSRPYYNGFPPLPGYRLSIANCL